MKIEKDKNDALSFLYSVEHSILQMCFTESNANPGDVG